MNIGFIGEQYKSSIIISALLLENQDMFINVLSDEYSKITANRVIVYKQVEELIVNSSVLIIDTGDYEQLLKKYKNIIKEKLIIFLGENVEESIVLKYTHLFTIVIPNIFISSNKGYTLICKNNNLDPYLQEIVEQECIKIFKQLGNIKVIYFEEISIYNDLINNSIIYFANILDNMSKHFINNGIDEIVAQKLLANSMEIAANKIKMYDEPVIRKVIKNGKLYNEDVEKSIKFIDELGVERLYTPLEFTCEVEYEDD